MGCPLYWQPLCEYDFCHCDLDLWPSDLKINRGHLQVTINVPMKCHDPRQKRSWVIIRKSFDYFGSLWPWPCDLKINRGHLRVMINVPMKFHDPRRMRSWLIIRQPPGGRTDRPTDRPTDMSKAIYPLFFEGGHNKEVMAILAKFNNLTLRVKVIQRSR